MNRLKLTPAPRRRLQRQLQQTADARIYRRTLALREYNRGRSVTEIAPALGVTCRRISSWMAAYKRGHDPSALQQARRAGRPRLGTQPRQALLGTLLETSPHRLGYGALNGTVPLLQEQSERETGHRLSEDTIRRELQRQGYVWKRFRYVLDPDPDTEKKRSIRQFVRHLRRETALVIAEETDLLLLAAWRAGWAPKGQAATVVLRGFNARRVLFGAMNLRSGRGLFVVRERQRRPDFQGFLQALRKRSGRRPIALLLDEDPSPTAKGSVARATQLNITLLWLPKRSPELNPMATLWGQAKDLLLANRQ